MAKIWRLNYKQYYGNRGNYWMKSVDIHDEERFNREIKKLKDGEGTIEIFESTEKIDIQAYISSIMRDNQLDSVLVVADEKSILYSKFKELLSNSKTVEGTNESSGYSKKYLKVLMDEWDFSPTTQNRGLDRPTRQQMPATSKDRKNTTSSA